MGGKKIEALSSIVMNFAVSYLKTALMEKLPKDLRFVNLFQSYVSMRLNDLALQGSIASVF